MRSKALVLALPIALGSLSAALAGTTTMTGEASAPKTISGVTSGLVCDDYSIAAFDVPSCATGALCANLGNEITSAELSGNLSSGKCSYTLSVPDNKKFLISFEASKHTPKCSGASSGTVLLFNVTKGPKGPIDTSGLPGGVDLSANYTFAAQCVAPPK